jgi:hypothetical protein
VRCVHSEYQLSWIEVTLEDQIDLSTTRHNSNSSVELGRRKMPCAWKNFFGIPFDLSIAPLVRKGIFKSRSTTYLALAIHYIVIESESLCTLTKEIQEMYNDLATKNSHQTN